MNLLNTWGSRTEIPGKFGNGDQLEQPCEKLGSVTKGQGGERIILHTIKRRKANWIGHILRRYGLTKHVTEGKI